MKKTLRHLRLLAFIASFALFVYVLQRSSPEAVLHNIRLLGWGFAFLILLSGARHLLRAVAWSYCNQTQGHRPGALDLFGPRLVGEALDDLTPAGPLLGETAKVAVVSRLIPGQAGASSVVIENLVYILAAVLFMLSGLVLALLKLVTPNGFRWISGETGDLLPCLDRRCLLDCPPADLAAGKNPRLPEASGTGVGISRAPPALPARRRAGHLRLLPDSPTHLSRRLGN